MRINDENSETSTFTIVPFVAELAQFPIAKVLFERIGIMHTLVASIKFGVKNFTKPRGLVLVQTLVFCNS